MTETFAYATAFAAAPPLQFFWVEVGGKNYKVGVSKHGVYCIDAVFTRTAHFGAFPRRQTRRVVLGGPLGRKVTAAFEAAYTRGDFSA